MTRGKLRRWYSVPAGSIVLVLAALVVTGCEEPFGGLFGNDEEQPPDGTLTVSVSGDADDFAVLCQEEQEENEGNEAQPIFSFRVYEAGAEPPSAAPIAAASRSIDSDDDHIDVSETARVYDGDFEGPGEETWIGTGGNEYDVHTSVKCSIEKGSVRSARRDTELSADYVEGPEPLTYEQNGDVELETIYPEDYENGNEFGT